MSGPCCLSDCCKGAALASAPPARIRRIDLMLYTIDSHICALYEDEKRQCNLRRYETACTPPGPVRSDSVQQEWPLEMTHMHLACTPGHALMILMLPLGISNVVAQRQWSAPDLTDMVCSKSPSSVHVKKRRIRGFRTASALASCPTCCVFCNSHDLHRKKLSLLAWSQLF